MHGLVVTNFSWVDGTGREGVETSKVGITAFHGFLGSGTIVNASHNLRSNKRA